MNVAIDSEQTQFLAPLDKAGATPGGHSPLVVEAAMAKILAANNEQSWADLGDDSDATMLLAPLN
jgi:hypothetical protein